MYLIRILLFEVILFFSGLSLIPVYAATVNTCLVINLPSKTIEYVRDKKIVCSYPIAIGKPSTPTPLGNYHILTKDIDPTWYPPGKDYYIPSGPDNPLGYRWMGFYGNYGIHGTNAPWSVGNAVSNGCIRMIEQDVEVLYDLVEVDLPVYVTYNRVKITEDISGSIALTIYPDVYGYKNLDLADIHTVLKPYNLDMLINNDILTSILQSNYSTKIPIARHFNISINGQLLTEQGIQFYNQYYVPLVPIANHLHTPITIIPNSTEVYVNQKSVPAIISKNRVYVLCNNLSVIFGGKHTYSHQTNTLTSNITQLYINNQQIPGIITIHDNTIKIPVDGLVKALEFTYRWNQVQKRIMKARFGDDIFLTLDPNEFYKKYQGILSISPDNSIIEIIFPLLLKSRND